MNDLESSKKMKISAIELSRLSREDGCLQNLCLINGKVTSATMSAVCDEELEYYNDEELKVMDI